jgi:hypothetical protein
MHTNGFKKKLRSSASDDADIVSRKFFRKMKVLPLCELPMVEALFSGHMKLETKML